MNDITDLKPGDRIRVTQIIRSEKNRRVQKDCKVVHVYQTYLAIHNGRYRTSIHLHDIETGEVEIEII